MYINMDISSEMNMDMEKNIDINSEMDMKMEINYEIDTKQNTQYLSICFLLGQAASTS